MGKPNFGLVASLWIAALCVGCGQGDGTEKASGDQGLKDSTSLEAMAGVVAAGGSIDYASRPEGGAVLVGAASREGDGQRFDPAGLVVDVKGDVALTFELPQATDVRSITVSGGRAVVLGMACEGVSREDDTTGERNCVPGGTVGFEIDTASGKVTSLELPDDAVARYMATDVIGVGRDGLVLTAQGPDGAFSAWSRGGVGDWRSIEAPDWYPCQVGMSAVVVPPVTGDGGTGRPAASVLDFDTGQWRDPVTSPHPIVADSVEQTMCTTDRVVVFGGRPTSSEATLDTFDPEAQMWRSVPVPDVDGGPVLEGRPGLHDVVISSMGVGLEAPAVVFDPVTGAATSTDLSFTGPADYVGISPERALVFNRDGSFSISEVNA